MVQGTVVTATVGFLEYTVGRVDAESACVLAPEAPPADVRTNVHVRCTPEHHTVQCCQSSWRLRRVYMRIALVYERTPRRTVSRVDADSITWPGWLFRLRLLLLLLLLLASWRCIDAVQPG